jgi:hypothetical protein
MRHRTLTWALALVPMAAATAAATVDLEIRRPVNYYDLVPPAAGQSYIDPVFGTAIRRITDARHQPDSADTGTLDFIVHEYSTMSPFNQDDSLVVLMHQSYFALYDGEGRYLRDLAIGPGGEPRWSRTDPNVLYARYGNALWSYDTRRDVWTLVRTFAEYSTISGRGESDICFDGDHFVLVGDGHDIFVYELSTGTKGPVFDATGHGFDNLYIAPGDQVIVTWYDRGDGPTAGVALFDRNMNFQRQLAPVGGHMDVGRDVDGQAVLLWLNTADPQAPADCQNGVVKIRLADGARTCVLSLGWGMSAHVSAPDSGEWFFVSTYASNDPDPSQGGWRRYTGEVLQVRLDGTDVRRLAHHRSRPFNDYWYMPRASVSRDGQRLVFSSNYGLPSILGYVGAYSDVYLVDLAATALASIGSESPASSHYAQDDASVTYSGTWYSNAFYLHRGGTAAQAVDAGARATFRFSGTGVRWIGYRDEWAGVANVYLDGQLRDTVDTYGSPFRPQTVLFSALDLAPGNHALMVEATGTRGGGSGGAWVWVDGFETVTRAEQDDPAVSYVGSWQTNGLGPVGATARLSADAGARATFQFSGTSASWIGRRDMASGIARVYLDGALRAEIDTYSALPEAPAPIYTLSGLAPGNHTLAVEVAGRHDLLSLGNWILVDAFESAEGP